MASYLPSSESEGQTARRLGRVGRDFFQKFKFGLLLNYRRNPEAQSSLSSVRNVLRAANHASGTHVSVSVRDHMRRAAPGAPLATGIDESDDANIIPELSSPGMLMTGGCHGAAGITVIDSRLRLIRSPVAVVASGCL